MEIQPIAHIKTDFTEKFGLPRQSGRAGLRGVIIFEPPFRDSNMIRGLSDFSHLWLIFGFSQTQGWSATVRPPRLGGNKRVGVFATRSPFRPNHLGLSSVKFIKTEQTAQGSVLIVEGVDLLDGTPIYDIKPYIPFSDSHPDAKAGFADENQNHKLDVEFPTELLCFIPDQKRQPLIDCLSDDPRPSYQTDERIYSMKFDGFDISFRICDNTLTVLKVERL